MVFGFYIDAFLSLLTYGILVGFIVMRYNAIKKSNQADDDDDDGGLGFDIDHEPTLDLPPGVVLPGEGPSVEIYEEDFA